MSNSKDPGKLILADLGNRTEGIAVNAMKPADNKISAVTTTEHATQFSKTPIIREDYR